MRDRDVDGFKYILNKAKEVLPSVLKETLDSDIYNETIRIPAEIEFEMKDYIFVGRSNEYSRERNIYIAGVHISSVEHIDQILSDLEYAKRKAEKVLNSGLFTDNV